MADHAGAFTQVCTVSLFLCLIPVSQAGKILIATTPVGKSHMLNLKKIAKEVEERGTIIMVHLALVYLTLIFLRAPVTAPSSA